MSGLPSTDGVAMFRLALRRYSFASDRISILREEIEVRKKEIDSQIIEAQTSNRKMFELMEKMDVAARGNTGYEGRASWFMAELYKQLTAVAASPSSDEKEKTDGV